MSNTSILKSKPSVIVSLCRWLFVFALSIVMIIPGLLFALLSKRLARYVQFIWARTALWILGVKITVNDKNAGEYKNGPYVFTVLNQSSLLEGFATICFLPVQCTPIVNIEYALLPFLGWSKWILGGIVIMPKNRSQALGAMKTAQEKLINKENIYVSIEGKRTKNGELGEYKKGPVVIAINSGATIIPFYYSDMRERLPYGEWRVCPGVVEMTFCPSISTQGKTYEDRDGLVRELREIAELGVR